MKKQNMIQMNFLIIHKQQLVYFLKLVQIKKNGFIGRKKISLS